MHLSSKIIYHQATLDLLGSDFARKGISIWENAGGLPWEEIPASVREWYALPFGIDALSRCSNDDHVLAPSSFVLHEYEGQHILQFLVENQGCWTCGILLDGSDDPPVVITESVSAERVVWSYCAERFSIFIYTRMFDHQYWDEASNEESEGEDDWFLDGPALTEKIRHRLETDFQREPSTILPGYLLHRYSRASKRQRLVIWETDRGAQWQWIATAAPERQQLRKYVTALISF